MSYDELFMIKRMDEVEVSPSPESRPILTNFITHPQTPNYLPYDNKENQTCRNYQSILYFEN